MIMVRQRYVVFLVRRKFSNLLFYHIFNHAVHILHKKCNNIKEFSLWPTPNTQIYSVLLWKVYRFCVSFKIYFYLEENSGFVLLLVKKKIILHISILSQNGPWKTEYYLINLDIITIQVQKAAFAVMPQTDCFKPKFTMSPQVALMVRTPANGRHKSCGFNSGWEQPLEEGTWQPTQVFALENPHRRSLRATVHNAAKSWTWLKRQHRCTKFIINLPSLLNSVPSGVAFEPTHQSHGDTSSAFRPQPSSSSFCHFVLSHIYLSRIAMSQFLY